MFFKITAAVPLLNGLLANIWEGLGGNSPRKDETEFRKDLLSLPLPYLPSFFSALQVPSGPRPDNS